MLVFKDIIEPGPDAWVLSN